MNRKKQQQYTQTHTAKAVNIFETKTTQEISIKYVCTNKLLVGCGSTKGTTCERHRKKKMYIYTKPSKK